MGIIASSTTTSIMTTDRPGVGRARHSIIKKEICRRNDRDKWTRKGGRNMRYDMALLLSQKCEYEIERKKKILRGSIGQKKDSDPGLPVLLTI